MAIAIVSILLTFVLTGVIGNMLVQHWQYRNWINQQKFLGEEKQYYALTALWEELTNLASKRLWRMRRLHAALTNGDDEKIKERLNDYDLALSEWNEKFHSMSVRLTLYSSWDLERELEDQLQRSFLDAGLRLERLTKTRLATGTADKKLVRELLSEFFDLSRTLFRFNRSTLAAVQRQKSRTYYGVEVVLTRWTLDKFGTWELLKALFQPGIKPFRVVRPAADFGPPFRSGS
jgi:hypothetical protein